MCEKGSCATSLPLAAVPFTHAGLLTNAACVFGSHQPELSTKASHHTVLRPRSKELLYSELKSFPFFQFTCAALEGFTMRRFL